MLPRCSASPPRCGCSVFFLLCHRPRRRTLGYFLTRRERGEEEVCSRKIWVIAPGSAGGKSPLLGQTLKDLMSSSPPMEDPVVGGSGVEERLGKSRLAAKGDGLRRAFRRRVRRGKYWRPALGGIPE